MSHKILIVDDELPNLRLLERLFRRDYNVISAASGMDAMRLLEQHDVALIITDQRMPGMSGIELLKRTASLRPHMVRIILTGFIDVGALVEAINCGQIYKYVTKPWNNDELRLTVERALQHYDTNRSRHELAHVNERLVSQMKAMTRSFVRSVADALEAKDEYIHGHSRRVGGYAVAIGRRMGLDEISLEQLRLAAFLHDVGKIGTPEQILLKPGSLSSEEHAVMRLHPRRGARMLTGIADMERVADAVLHHHEHFDGTGYPNLLRGDQIPILSRIILVADAYDALTSPRPFRAACAHIEAIEQLEKAAGSQFDPEVVHAFTGIEALQRIRMAVVEGPENMRLSPFWLASASSETTFGELIAEIETEPLIAASVLRAANNEADGPPTASLDVAFVRLGESRVREISARSSSSFERDAAGARLWEHSLRTAEAMRLLAEKAGIINPDEAYALGLLHDVGEALLFQLFPVKMREIQVSSDSDRSEQELVEFGVDHGQIGQWVLESCGFPTKLAAAVQAHHDVARINSSVALMLHLANSIAHADNPYKVAAVEIIDNDQLYSLGLGRNDLFHIHTCIQSTVEQKLDPVV